MSTITHKEAWHLLQAGVRIGTLPSFAYILGTHVLHRMGVAGERKLQASLHDLYGTVLYDANDGLVLAGQIEHVVHQGMGLVLSSRPKGISLLYVDALQKLHAAGILFTSLAKPPQRPLAVTMGHFTMHPNLREGIDWEESTPLHWELPSVETSDTIARFAAIFETCTVASTGAVLP